MLGNISHALVFIKGDCHKVRPGKPEIVLLGEDSQQVCGLVDANKSSSVCPAVTLIGLTNVCIMAGCVAHCNQ